MYRYVRLTQPKLHTAKDAACCDATVAAPPPIFLLIISATGCADIEIAQVLISLLLVDRHALASSFLEFLKQQDSYKGLNVDQWTSLLEFCKTIDVNFGNYDENGACTYPLPLFPSPAHVRRSSFLFAGPCVLDEWVTWAKEKKEGEEGADS